HPGTASAGTAEDLRLQRAALRVRAEELDLEQQRRPGGDDAAGAVRTVAERRRDDEPTLAADLHPLDALVPALDHLAGAEAKAEGHAAVLVGAVDLAPLVIRHARVEQPERVEHLDLLAARRGGAVALLQILDLQRGAGVAGLLDVDVAHGRVPLVRSMDHRTSASLPFLSSHARRSAARPLASSMSSTSSAVRSSLSSSRTRRRGSGAITVSRSCSGFISPSPLKRWMFTLPLIFSAAMRSSTPFFSPSSRA